MKLTKLSIEGFRSIKDKIEVGISNRTTFVGKNNSGKSNIIKVLDWILGEKYHTYLDINETDFHKDSSEIIIQAFLKFEDAEKPAIFSIFQKYNKINVVDGNGNRREWYQQSFLTNVSNEIKIELKIRRILPTESPENIDKYILSNDENYICESTIYWSSTHYTKQGLSKEQREKLIMCLIVPSIRNHEKDFKISDYSIFGKLIREVYYKNKSSYESEINRNLANVNTEVNNIFRAYTDNIQKEIKKAIPNNTIGFKFGQIETDNLYKNIRLYVDDGVDTPIECKGTGIQSILIVSFFREYCKLFHKQNSLLCLEEPELFLHPHGKRYLSEEIDKLCSEQGPRKTQIIISSHSPEFININKSKSIDEFKEALTSIVLVSKNGINTEISQIPKSAIDLLDTADLESLRKELNVKNEELFFASFVILCEGESEEIVLPAVSRVVPHPTDPEKSCNFDEYNISVVSVEGKGTLGIFSKLLQLLKMPYMVVVDNDILQNKRELKKLMKYNGIDENLYLDAQLNFTRSISDIKSELKQNNNIVILDGCFEDTFPDELVAIASGKSLADVQSIISANISSKPRAKIIASKLIFTSDSKPRIASYIGEAITSRHDLTPQHISDIVKSAIALSERTT